VWGLTLENGMKSLLIGGLAALCLAGLSLAAEAADVKFDLVNNSARAVKNFFTSPTETTNWEEDVLGEETIPPGETDTVTISTADGQCIYDMRFIMEDDAELVVNGIDMCTLSSYTLSDAK